MAKVLLLEDDLDLSDSLPAWLRANQYLVDLVSCAEDALSLLRSFNYDLLILDWELPDGSGVDVLKHYRGSGGFAPVLMLTGKTSDVAKEKALDAGADDYLTKPFSPRELGARLRALLRRPRQMSDTTVTVGDITLDTAAKKVTKNGQVVALRPLEMTVLEFFMRHTNQAFSAEHLLSVIWDADQSVSSEALYTCIRRIRRQLDNAETGSSVITTVHGHGYRMDG